MNIRDVFDAARYLSGIVDKINRFQLDLTVGDDFDEYRALISSHRGFQPVGRPFDPEQSFLTRSNAMWIVGRNPAGDVVHTQALRLLDLHDHSLARYMARRFVDFPPPGVDIDLDGSWFRPGPGAAQIVGRVVYHGDMWLADDPQYRGRGLIDVLARFAFLSAMLHWQPDHVFGFIKRPIARRGLAEREGYMHSDPCCLSWKVTGQNEPVNCNMVWMALRDLCHVMHVPTDDRIPA